MLIGFIVAFAAITFGIATYSWYEGRKTPQKVSYKKIALQVQLTHPNYRHLYYDEMLRLSKELNVILYCKLDDDTVALADYTKNIVEEWKPLKDEVIHIWKAHPYEL